ncbi:GNAT family N-acetyltransferase [Flavobacterium agrisoli]|uniref:GNAT family N-acetyltransferase n=1 Tax=Flavobacterium agrisoli TaxID=2793066 RepID=A0A934PK71_9FLAO|nr:GNAT family N-acetyltransferase [Flavobacterium agrisoli]MBK0369112.1 GNAT family N-acetyltransferase [Flavobacterium agrisoli]
MHFRKANNSDLEEMKNLFQETIRSVCSHDYNSAQINEWISTVQNTQRWLEMLASQFVLLAIVDDKMAGFGTLKNGNYIDFFYIHKDFQKRGIATQLLEKLEQEARHLESKTISSDVSITAKPFFEKLGFKVLKEQHNHRNGLILINYKMRKELQ